MEGLGAIEAVPKAERSTSVDSPATVPSGEDSRSGLGEGDNLGLGLGVGDGMAIGVGLGVGLGEGDELAVGEGLGEGDGEGEGLGLGEGHIKEIKLPVGVGFSRRAQLSDTSGILDKDCVSVGAANVPLLPYPIVSIVVVPSRKTITSPSLLSQLPSVFISA